VGAGFGLVTTRVLHRLTCADLGGGAWAVSLGGLTFYLAYDVAALNRWPLWTGALLAWAVWERARRGRR